ncbi:retinol-binding protein pinta-like [Photinus pyralis]|uniref:retinol-binding protein pinta-like n=1 Tax=Photinus pyralis TaxID=7054 RepID=UPI001267159E|nr:retinol-binding protein pinta-like [Photinus pyralis]
MASRYRPLSEQLKKFAQEELNEVEDRVDDDVRHIKDWFVKQAHLNFQLEDQLVLSFLRCTKFRLEKAKEKINGYFTMRSLIPALFSTRDPFLPELQRLLNAGIMVPLPKVDERGSRILLSTSGKNLNPDTMSLQSFAKICYMIADILLREDDQAIVNGLTIVIACKGAQHKYVPQLTPTFIKEQAYVVLNAPFRISGMYIVDCHPIFHYAYNITSFLLPQKIKKRVVIFTEANSHEVYTNIPRDLFPEELGGSNGSLKELTVEWKKKVESYREWFLQDEKLRSNEDLRQGKPKASSDFFEANLSGTNLPVGGCSGG